MNVPWCSGRTGVFDTLSPGSNPGGTTSLAKKAIVLAAGFGTRLRPLTCSVPKPLMPVWGEPMLARVVAMLREWGVEDIVVNCHYLHEQVEEWCAANGCKASYEPEILGTGGVLNPLRDWIGEDDFYLVNGDIVVEAAPRPNFKGDEIACALVTEEGPRTIELEPESGFVTNWKSDDAGYPGTFTYCGITLLRAEILKYVEPTGFSSIVSAYEKAMMDGRFVRGKSAAEMLWTDAGTISSYIELNQDGEDNAFADIPQLKAIGAKAPKFIGARGSDRVFFRDEDGVIVIYDDSKRGENAKYVGHARWLKDQGVPVPAIIRDEPKLKTMVMEWAGAECKMSLNDYAAVIRLLVKFNSLDATALALEPPFDAAMYEWERNLFTEQLLGPRFKRELSAAELHELKSVADKLEQEPVALVHRDFQSTNVLWKNNRPYFIDFQGMRLGAAVYDLASLVYDPYVKLSQKYRDALIELYAKESGRKEVVQVVHFAAVQRLVQCLGAYGRLAAVGQPQFSKFILPALENLLSAADKADLDAIGGLAEELIAAEEHLHHHHH